ncbi:MAG: translation initiation factor IF-2 [Candidatus Vogelbacteria bacterium]|nr:translation initiation factor IF-2 [Candidatus Vogelbacteria bacterium]
MAKKTIEIQMERAPIVAVMGHIDHGKSTLLDYIRKTNIVDKEAGGITQHLGAYEVVHTTSAGDKKTIAFLDTPGHEAFSKMRRRGAEVADIVILVVAADDGVKQQTIEAVKTIEAAKVPYIVAINKIDKPNANVEKVKIDLASNNVFLEGFGGTVPFVPISAKTGEGIPELLDVTLLMSEMAELKRDDSKDAEGFVIESNLDPKRGGSATLILRNGTLKKGSFIVIGKNITPVRYIENSAGQSIDVAHAPSPVKVIGFSSIAAAGARWKSVSSKKAAEEISEQMTEEVLTAKDESKFENAKVVVPVILKADVSGSLEAIEKELLKLETADAKIKFLIKGVGHISENDIKTAAGSNNPLIIGFNVKIDNTAKDFADQLKLFPQTFKIIYEINPIIIKEIEERTPKTLIEETIGKAKILKIFSKNKDRQIIGGLVLEGNLILNKDFKIIRQQNTIGKGTILELQQQKVKVKEVPKGVQFGSMVESKITIAEDDTIEAFDVVKK